MNDGWQSGKYDAITDVPGIRVGHWSDRRGVTGCTVILCERATSAAVDVRGGAPGTRETDLLASQQLVRTCHAIVLTGGSAFGLAAADGVVRCLDERGIGFGTTAAKVPLVPAAVLYDLGIGKATARPGAEAGYRAAGSARGGRVAQGSIGAGTGATVAKLLGPERCLKAGIGTASLVGPRGIIVGALVANNAVGNVVNPETGELLAGPRDDARGQYITLPDTLSRRTAMFDALLENTTLVCVATNAKLEHGALERVTYHAHDGLARTIVPAHTAADGDTVFAVTTGEVEVAAYDGLTVGALAARTVELAILRSIEHATDIGGIPSARTWRASQT